MEHLIVYIAVSALILIACYPVYYLIGLAFSRGFHRGKQEHLSYVLNHYSNKEARSGARQRT